VTIAAARLANALAVWPLDREQRSFIYEATAGIGEGQAHALLDLLQEAETAVFSCADFLMEGAQSNQSPHSRQQPVVKAGLHRPKLRFRPLHDRVIVKRLDAEEMYKGGIIFPDTAKEKPQEGEIVAVGPGGRDESGKLIPIDLKAGDRVLFGKWSGTEVKIEGVELLIMKESDIMGVLDEPAELRRSVKGAA
jgi:chaperonin GroES